MLNVPRFVFVQCWVMIRSRLCISARNTRKWSGVLLSASCRGCVMSVWPVAGDGNFGLLLQGVSPGVLTVSVVRLLSWVASVRAGGGEDLCVPQFLACLSSCSFLNSHLLAFPLYHAASRECLPAPSYLVFPQVVVSPALPPGVWMYIYFLIINLKKAFSLKCSWIIVFY